MLGVHLSLLIGPTIAVPAPIVLTEALASAEVTQNDSGRSGFQLTFQVGRSGPLDLADYSLLINPLLRPLNRVILMVRFNLLPNVLIDGFITQFQLDPSEQPGGSTLERHRRGRQRDDGPRADGLPVPGAAKSCRSRRCSRSTPLLGWTGAVVLRRPSPTFRCRQGSADPEHHRLSSYLRRSRPSTATSSTSAPACCRTPTSRIGDRRCRPTRSRRPRRTRRSR